MKNKVFKIILQGYYKKLVLIVIFILINSLLTVAVSAVLMQIIDNVIPQNDVKMLVLAIVIYLVVIIIQLGISYLSSYLQTALMLDTTNNLKSRLVDNIYSRTGAFLSDVPKGELYAAVDSDSVTLCNFLVENIFSVIYTVCSFVVSAVYLGILNWKLFLLIIVLQPIALLFQMKIAPIISRLSLKNREVLAEYSSDLQNVVSSPADLKISGFKNYVIGRYSRSMEKCKKCTQKLLVVGFINEHIVQFFSAITTCTIIAFGGFSIINESMSFGVFIVFLTQSLKLISAFSDMLDLSVDISEVIPIIERVDTYIGDVPEKKSNAENISGFPDIEFNNVAFSYDGVKTIYNDLNIKFCYGKNYGIVGRTGEGKSTFVKLVYDLWQPEKGNITLGGVPTSELSNDTISEFVTYVPSDPMMINDTLRCNLLMGRTDVSDQDIVRVLENVCLINEVELMDNGLDTVIGDNGASLSSGQKQRIALARAMLDKKKIVVLDEPTSAIDRSTEKNVMKNVYNEFKGSTLIIITHDEDILYDCECVFKLEGGKMKTITSKVH